MLFDADNHACRFGRMLLFGIRLAARKEADIDLANQGSAADKTEIYVRSEVLAGAAGFEPANGGIKSRCLTTWRRPSMEGAPYSVASRDEKR